MPVSGILPASLGGTNGTIRHHEPVSVSVPVYLIYIIVCVPVSVYVPAGDHEPARVSGPTKYYMYVPVI